MTPTIAAFEGGDSCLGISSKDEYLFLVSFLCSFAGVQISIAGIQIGIADLIEIISYFFPCPAACKLVHKLVGYGFKGVYLSVRQVDVQLQCGYGQS